VRVTGSASVGKIVSRGNGCGAFEIIVVLAGEGVLGTSTTAAAVATVENDVFAIGDTSSSETT